MKEGDCSVRYKSQAVNANSESKRRRERERESVNAKGQEKVMVIIKVNKQSHITLQEEDTSFEPLLQFVLRQPAFQTAPVAVLLTAT